MAFNHRYRQLFLFKQCKQLLCTSRCLQLVVSVNGLRCLSTCPAPLTGSEIVVGGEFKNGIQSNSLKATKMTLGECVAFLLSFPRDSELGMTPLKCSLTFYNKRSHISPILVVGHTSVVTFLV